jgi:hypothetical protein
VFTLPAPLRPLVRRHRAVLFDLLFAAASRTLLELGASAKHLGAQLGITAVLHTWNRELAWHPHLHCIVTGGGLTADGSAWRSARAEFLFPVFVMAALFRGKFLALLKRAIDEQDVSLGDEARNDLFDRLYRVRWIAFCKRPFGGPDQVIRYLSRYTHRVGISNHRLIAVDDDRVLFRTKDGKSVALPPLEFLRRLVQHVLPDRFVKIRHYGLHASSNVSTKLERAQTLLGGALPPAHTTTRVGHTWVELLLELTGIDVRVCRRCGARAVVTVPLLGSAPSGGGGFDTS